MIRELFCLRFQVLGRINVLGILALGYVCVCVTYKSQTRDLKIFQSLEILDRFSPRISHDINDNETKA